jgi:hypothetical protein
LRDRARDGIESIRLIHLLNKETASRVGSPLILGTS